ncbi:putative spermidine/putrescine transport system permease protein [Stella humosa]|uniref:Putative spermidine/putrescine transport system permease protein n=1 Tax=Stella humosa TaxID=94 RepID=A0A3N1KRZ7_9PROT|nr:ABC transporter permease [Stella humosa]ROP83361.1 putative spermidine/putrescine transport system permease protein [Stella humosa]BBK29855.1 polyamine ABC transporter permease [Stella humosa]
MKAGRFVALVAIVTLVFLVLPILIVVAMSFSSASSLQFPPPGLSLRWYQAFFGDPRWVEALVTSTVLAFASSIVALVLGSAAAYGIVRGRFPGRGFIDANFMAPLIVPTIVVAVALYLALAKVGLLGTWVGLVASHVVLSVPFVVLVVGVAIRSFDERIEQVAFTLGASRMQTVLRVLLPNLVPSLASAWILALIASFDEVIVTLFVAGVYQTVPKRMFNELVLEVNPTITAIATILIAISVLAMAAIAIITQRRGGLLKTMVGR